MIKAVFLGDFWIDRVRVGSPDYQIPNINRIFYYTKAEEFPNFLNSKVIQVTKSTYYTEWQEIVEP